METELVKQCNVCESDRLETVDPDFNIMRCSDCGFVFDSPRPTLREIIGFYSRSNQYDSWLDELDAREQLWKRRLKKIQSTKKNGSLLDVGAGIGQFLAIARGSYSNVHGTEVSGVAVEIAKRTYGLELFHGTIDHFSPPANNFANITLFHVLEHVPDPKSVLQRCHSLLAPHGILVIAVPNEVKSIRAYTRKMFLKAGLKKQKALGRFGLPKITLGPDSAEIHLSHFDPGVLRRLLQLTGFAIVKETLDPYYVAAGLARLKAGARYYGCLAYLNLFGANIYDATLMIAKKEEGTC